MANTENGETIDWQDTPAGQKLHARLSEERTLEAMDRLLKRIDKLEMAVAKLTDFMDQSPGLMAMTADAVDETWQKANQSGVSLEDKGRNLLTLLDIISDPKMTEQVVNVSEFIKQGPGLLAMLGDWFDENAQKAVERGFDPSMLAQTATQANFALTKARQEPHKKVGVFGIFSAMGDPDRKRAMGFLLNFLKYFGQALKRDKQ